MGSTDRRRHILFLTDCLAGFAGGSEKHIYELAKRLNKTKYRVTIASLEAEGTAPEEPVQATGCELKIFRVRRIYGLSGFRQGIAFRQYVKANKVDLLLTYHFGSDMWGTVWGRMAGVPVIISNRRDMGFWRTQRHIRTYRIFNRWVDRVIVVADAVKKTMMAEEGLAESKLVTIYNGVDFPSPSIPRNDGSLKSQFGIPPDDAVIMHVANLKPVKGHSFLLTAFAGVLKKFPRAVLILIGEDELSGSLQRLAQDLALPPRVLFLGKRPDARTLLPLADICVLTSLSEGMSNAILEYMAAGKPVVATRVGGNPELVKHEQNGLLVEKENVPQLAEALLTLLNDPIRRRRMGQQGYAMVQSRFSMPAMVERYEGLFDALLEEKEGS